VCHRCPVLTACREHALRVAEPYGVWGGLSAEEREDLLATQHRPGAMPTTVPSNSRDEVPVG